MAKFHRAEIQLKKLPYHEDQQRTQSPPFHGIASSRLRAGHDPGIRHLLSEAAEMLLRWLALVLGILLFAQNVYGIEKTKKIEAMNRVKMDKKQLDRVQQLHYGWYMQAVSAVLGSVGKQMYMKMKRDERRAFVACLDAIEAEHNVKAAANCLVHAFDGKLVESFPQALNDPKLEFVTDETDAVMPASKSELKTIKKTKMKKKIIKKAVTGKLKKSIDKIKKRVKKYNGRRKSMRKMLVTHNGVKKARSQEMEFRRRKRNVLSLYSNKEAAEEAKRVDNADRPFKIKNMDTFELKSANPSPVKTITKLINTVVRNGTSALAMNASYMRLRQLQGKVEEAKKEQNFKHRMLDMVIGKKNPLRRNKSFTDRMRDIVPTGSVDESVYGLVDAVSRHEKDINSNFLSPRFLPLMPDKYNTKKKILSPNLFPMYKDDTDNSILPLPNVLEATGMTESDRDTVLELVMDVSGVNQVVDGALGLMGDLKAAGLDKDLFDITKVMDGLFGDIGNSFSKEQKLEMANRKFTYLNKNQLGKLYGDDGLYNTSVTELPFDVNEVEALSPEEKHESMRMTVRQIAQGKGATQLPSRRKRQTTITLLDGAYKVVFLNPTLFSPQAFAPTINQLSVLGPLVISPQLFCPSVLSPLLMSLPVISPQVGNPLIFSPYVVGPNVMSAAVFNAYVFSPYVLSPNVINPYVLSPLILSPFVLCPDVVSPTILSGVVLSPSVLSPSIFTDSALAANVLSPTFLS
ncbi:unnamed protein product [Caenorhabditis auriculariae]|uniref:Uncharacterized protein n=1 Tax=Caenorhabditis auriculariae TaxID=2777116 RepID=A0A8S1H6E0_9PELO|nr:unnamed protein product [Caenorhabditis auriculariae]